MDQVNQYKEKATKTGKDLAQQGRAKYESMQAKRAADAMLHDLGAASYAEKSGRGGPNNGADIERITGKLEQHEKDNGPIDLSISA
jgi:hypothetical protein